MTTTRMTVPGLAETFYIPAWSIRGQGEMGQAARMEESNAAWWYAHDCAEADPEDFEPLRGWRIERFRGHERLRNRGLADWARSDIIPAYAVVRTGPHTAHVIHVSSGSVMGADRTIPEACALQKTLVETTRLGQVVWA